jgi:DNA-binding protein H-NS
LHLLSLLAAGETLAVNNESIWLIIIAILIGAVLLSLSSRLNNLDKMIKMLNDKIINLENEVINLKKQYKNKRNNESKPIINENVMISGPFNEDNVNPEELINNTPKISKLFDPRIKYKDSKDKNKEKNKSE